VYSFYKGLHVDERNGLGSVIVIEAEMSSDNCEVLEELCKVSGNPLSNPLTKGLSSAHRLSRVVNKLAGLR